MVIGNFLIFNLLTAILVGSFEDERQKIMEAENEARKKKLEAEANARKARAKAYTDAQFDARRTAGLSFDFRRSVLGYSSDKVATIERRQRKAAAGSKYGARWG